MVLSRIGNKRAIADELLRYFPPHDTYIEPFFGAGGMFFSKKKSKYNILNDLDGDVFNLWQVVRTRPDELADAVRELIVHESLLRHWEEHKESEPVMRAVRFLFLSNFTLRSMMNTLRVNPCGANQKNFIINRIKDAQTMLSDCIFTNKDAVSSITAIATQCIRGNYLFYCDPPYVNTRNNYQTDEKWTIDNLASLIAALQKFAANEPTRVKFAISEFDTPQVKELMLDSGLKAAAVVSRNNMQAGKTRKMEMIYTNYAPMVSLFA